MPADQRLRDFDRLVRQGMRIWNVPGMAVGIVRGNRIIHAKGYGLRDVKRGLPVTEKTRFGIGSCTKAFTAAALGMLVDEGKIDWDTPVRHYLPSFHLCDPVATERATPRDLLTHRTGLPAHNFAWVTSTATRSQMVERLRYLQPSADFRARFEYNNLMYMVAGFLIEHVTGKRWEQFLAERIFRPMGMDGTFCFHAGMQDAEDLAISYDKPATRIRPWKRGPGIDVFSYEGPVGPAGAICSNILDMCKWLQLQMNGGRLGKRTLISRQSLTQTHTPQIVCPADLPATVAGSDVLDASYGMGWDIQPYRGHRMLYHTGWVASYNTTVSFLPAENLGVVALTNFAPNAAGRIATFAAFDRLLGLEPIAWHLRWRKYWAGRMANRRKQERQRRTGRKGKTPRPLADYAGTYRHPGYGTVAIHLEKGKLLVRFKALRYQLRHHHGQEWDMVAMGELWNVRFGEDKAGRIGAITIPFEPSAPCTFKAE